jgi:hypothetical protein
VFIMEVQWMFTFCVLMSVFFVPWVLVDNLLFICVLTRWCATMYYFKNDE